MDRIERLKQMLVQQPNDSFLKHALGLEYQKLGDTKQAVLLFRSVLEADENYIGSYYQLAKLLEQQGDAAEAIKVYEKGIAKAKELGDQHALNELRSAYEELIY
ncbi:MAG TPA: tetratricopeptide repeat protein [Chitinophagaceae bacterium]|jgi:tetratricopeptide (TPR) repeat protein|nr:tetratricopeptide repeat protein [Chitinophagaceae bacterium]